MALLIKEPFRRFRIFVTIPSHRCLMVIMTLFALSGAGQGRRSVVVGGSGRVPIAIWMLIKNTYILQTSEYTGGQVSGSRSNTLSVNISKIVHSFTDIWLLTYPGIILLLEPSGRNSACYRVLRSVIEWAETFICVCSKMNHISSPS